MLPLKLSLAIAVAFVLTGCEVFVVPGPETESADTPGAELPTETVTQAGATRIDLDRIGPVALGMTFGEAKQALPADVTFEIARLSESVPYAIAVNQGTETLLYLVTQQQGAELPPDERVIQFLSTRSSRYTTAEGIGPGSPVQEAVTAYGAIQLYYSPSVEYAEFEHQPASEAGVIGFQVQRPEGKPAAGIYEWSDAEAGDCSPGETGYCETTQFEPEALIAEVSVSAIP